MTTQPLQVFADAIRNNPDIRDGFRILYGTDAIDTQQCRYQKLIEEAACSSPAGPVFFISAPGRTEIGGNHTDHNNGRVIASAVDLDCVALIIPSLSSDVRIFTSLLNRPVTLQLDSLDIVDEEKGSPESLVRGVAAGLNKRFIPVPGFTAFLHSTCRPGTGLSSSAAFSICTAASFCFINNGSFRPGELARIARSAENNFFGKPCGLMDQLSSAVGGTLAIDFMDPEHPKITDINADLNDFGRRMVIVNTGSSHEELTADYAAVPNEIAQAIRVFNTDAARGLTMEAVLDKLPQIRKKAGDRAALRLMHFINEDSRAAAQAEALTKGDYRLFLQLVEQSGESSCTLLQNCSSLKETVNQGILLALAVTRQLCPEAVCRVHGGGFAGTIQAYIPDEKIEGYTDSMDRIFGTGAVMPVKTGRPGVCSLTPDGWYFPETTV